MYLLGNLGWLLNLSVLRFLQLEDRDANSAFLVVKPLEQGPALSNNYYCAIITKMNKNSCFLQGAKRASREIDV